MIIVYYLGPHGPTQMLVDWLKAHALLLGLPSNKLPITFEPPYVCMYVEGETHSEAFGSLLDAITNQYPVP